MTDLHGIIYYDGAQSYDIFYRVRGSSGPWLSGGSVVAAAEPNNTEYTIQNIAPNEYEIYYISHCQNGEESVPSDTFYSSPTCQQPRGFNVTQSGNNFVIVYTVPSSVGMVNLRIEYPNGGTFDQNYGVSQLGTITVPIPAGQFGDFTFSLRSVCNEDSGWYSPYMNSIEMTIANPAVCPAPVINDYLVISVSLTEIIYRFTLGSATSSVRVVLTNNTTGNQQFYQPSLIDGKVDVPLAVGSVAYNYTVAFFNICSAGTDNIGDLTNILVAANAGQQTVSTAGWTVSAGPDTTDVNGDQVIGTMVTVNTNTVTPSSTRTTRIVVRFNCSNSGYAYVNVAIPPGATFGTTRDWNSGCTIDVQSGYIISAYFL
jgi:hypothetical protein